MAAAVALPYLAPNPTILPPPPQSLIDASNPGPLASDAVLSIETANIVTPQRKVSPPHPRRQPPPPPLTATPSSVSSRDSSPDSPLTPVDTPTSSNSSRKKKNRKPKRPHKKLSLRRWSPDSSPPPPNSPTIAEMADPVKDGESTEDNFEDAQESTPRPSSVEKDEEQVQESSQEQPTESTTSEDKKDVDDEKESTPENPHSTQASLEPALELPPRPRSKSPSKVRSRQPSPVKTTTEAPAMTSIPSSPDTERIQSPPIPPTERPGSSSAPEAPSLPRKASSGFAGLFGRIGRKAAKSPPRNVTPTERRGTVTSVRSTDSTATNMSRPTLQDQFRTLRKQEEMAAQEGDGVTNGDSESERRQSDASASRPNTPREQPLSPSLPAVNLKLPPGTASGISAGPAEEPRPVDWDLWQQVVYEGPSALSRSSAEELNRAIASGIPPAIRGVVWQVLAGSKNEELEGVYRSLKARGTDAEPRSPVRSPSSSHGAEKESIKSSASSVHSDSSTTAGSTTASIHPSIDSASAEVQAKAAAEKQKKEAAALVKLEKAIKRDMGSRTSFSKYTQSAGLQDGLFGVCKAYALFDESVGYAQGINFITMPLLFNMSEEEAFTLLVRLMGKFDLRSLFTADMAGLHLRLYQFERILEDREPALYCHLKRRSVTPQLYATQWFLTLFAYRFPLQLVLRVYDLILTEGLSAILKFGIVLMQRNRDALLQMKDMSQLTTFLKEKIFDVYIDKAPSASSLLDSGFFGSVTGGADKELYRADELVRDACEVSLPEATLAQYAAEWEETSTAERERQELLDSLRAQNSNLTARVKNLEERTQQQDTEHVSIAGDLINLKLANESLTDENEVLKTKVEELQRMVDLQPGEVEARLKDEMERIMTRNIEVQNENRALREEMDEVETELVKVKMSHAQAQADHDSLRQKWSSVQAMLNNGS